ncbi:hypothetical protein IPP75_02885 [Candidatus Saccharibacteria bacterium]|nr:MAG: hypothetical protein IPP75_02885 [Candidatus Saccharibacteria bacterium]
MTDDIKKFLRKLTKKQLEYVLPYMDKIERNDLAGLDCKPLRGHRGFFRVRAGSYRIVFYVMAAGENRILNVGKRDDQTYRDF